MKNLVKLLFLSFLTACSSSTSEKTEASKDSKSELKFPYSYVDTRKEENNNGYNEMILYTCGENYNVDTLKMFCKEQKERFNEGAFHIIVFFNIKTKAVFPNNPVTGMYIEDEPMKNIKAVYTFNRINGHSKLSTYEKNCFESKSVEQDI
jgi:hypothetical protein